VRAVVSLHPLDGMCPMGHRLMTWAAHLPRLRQVLDSDQTVLLLGILEKAARDSRLGAMAGASAEALVVAPIQGNL
jgi:hypothetical protein